MEADRIEFKRGSFVYVTPNTNFVSVKGEKATIQLAFNTPAAGPNGIGGITVDGTTSGVQMKTDKKGNVMYEMNVQGVAVSAPTASKTMFPIPETEIQTAGNDENGQAYLVQNDAWK